LLGIFSLAYIKPSLYNLMSDSYAKYYL